MSQPVQTDAKKQGQDPRQLAKWARVFGQNRGGIGVVVSLLIFALLWAIGGVFSHLAGGAYRAGNALLLTICLGVLVVWLAGVVCLSVPRWGGKLMERIVRWICRDEGHVTILAPKTGKRRWLALVLGLMACLIASVLLDFLLRIPHKYMQPVSALYVVPFLVGVVLVARPSMGLLALAWPMLYALHAMAILFGVPIVFTGRWEGLNMLIPIVGYGILAGLAGYVYSRYALRKLRILSQASLPGEASNEETRGDA
ncbi:MAG: hypothetical protein JXQ73_28190 [Phycisphaerae bacterium]|nr:hypothetical protein [Phycisphaerae bacterium]